MTLDFEYGLFSGEDPIKMLQEECRKIPLRRRYKMVPHINRCKSLYLKCKKFREILRDDKNPNHMLIGMTFSAFFGETIDKGVFAVLPKDVTYAYLSYLSKNVHVADDKYMRSATNFILANSDGIDAFVKTFLCIRLAQGEIDKLKTA